MKYFRNANQRQRWIVIRWPEIQDLTKQTGFLNWQIISRTPLEGIFFFAVSAVDLLPCRVYQTTYLFTSSRNCFFGNYLFVHKDLCFLFPYHLSFHG